MSDRYTEEVTGEWSGALSDVPQGGCQQQHGVKRHNFMTDVPRPGGTPVGHGEAELRECNTGENRAGVCHK